MLCVILVGGKNVCHIWKVLAIIQRVAAQLSRFMGA